MTSLTLQLPTILHAQLCELAKVAERTPETLAVALVRDQIEQAFEEGSADIILADFEYGTKQAAIRVARAASTWAASRRNFGIYQVEPIESGQYTVFEI